MVVPPVKFVWGECWKVNHIKFSISVKLAFEDLFAWDVDARCGGLKDGGAFTLEEDSKVSLAELVD